MAKEKGVLAKGLGAMKIVEVVLSVRWVDEITGNPIGRSTTLRAPDVLDAANAMLLKVHHWEAELPKPKPRVFRIPKRTP